MRISKKIFFLLIPIVIGIVLMSLSNKESVEKPLNTKALEVFVYQKINSILLDDDDFSFAGEAVPLNDEEVKERLDRELLVNTYWQSNTLLSLKLADKYFPIIEPILKRYNIPDDFKYIALIESGLRDVTSPAGAQGKWQFMRETGTRYGLVINDEVDERYNIEKSTIAACRYFQEAHDQFGNWTCVAASYNMGIAGLSRRITEQEVDTNYYDLFLNTETSRYVFRAVAMKAIHQNPKKYGYILPADETYEVEKYKYQIVETTIPNLTSFAKSNGFSYKQLKVLNPWLRSSKLTIKEGNTYHVKIPS